MTTQSVDICSMLNKAQNDFNQQNSVAAFFRQAGSGNPNVQHSLPMMINNPPSLQGLNSLEQIERQIRTSPPSLQDTQNNNNNGNGLQTAHSDNLANSPLAQFFNSNNFNSAPRATDVNPLKENKPINDQQPVGAPPGFKAQQQKKETKLITPAMLAPSSEKKQQVTAEPLTKNQLLHALSYLIENDDDFMLKVHQAYINSIKGLST